MAKTVLIVDDNADTNAVLRKVFSASGWHVISAADAVQGVQFAFAQNQPLELVILDYQMPAGSGASVYHRLRAGAQTKTSSVIFVSGASDTDELSKIVEADPKTRFLPKPVKVSRLLELAEQLVSGEASAETPLDLD